MSNPSNFECLSGSIGQALALYGGNRQTRLTAQASPGDTTFTVEHTEDWPSRGRISVGGITYTYGSKTQLTFENLQAVIAYTPLPGVRAVHPPASGVIDLSETYSEIDALRNSLFLPTAGGEDLAVLGRGFGVPRDESLSGDDQYRQVIRAIAYAPATSISALEQALDALLGPGAYSIDEDPIAYPGQVFLTVSYASQGNVSPVGRAYLAGPLQATPEANGSLTLPADASAAVPILLAPYDVAQDCTKALPSAAGGWSWQASTESTDCRMVSEGAQGQSASIVNLTSSYRTTAPTYRPGATNRLTVLLQVSNPTNLYAGSLNSGLVGSIEDGERSVAWSITGGPTPQIAITNGVGGVVAGPVNFDPSFYRAVSLTLSPLGAILRVDGRVTLSVVRSALGGTVRARSALGNVGGVSHSGSGSTAPRVQIRSLAVYSKDTQDYSLSTGTSGKTQASSSITLPLFALPAKAVGSQLWMSGSAKNTYGGTASGRYRIASITGPNTAVLQGEPCTDGQLIRASDGSSLFVPGTDTPLRYPEDLGKTLVVTTPGAGVAGSYTIQKLYDPNTGRDLSTFSTRLRQNSFLAKLNGPQVLAQDSLAYRVDPVFVTDTVSWQLSLAPAAVADGSVVHITTAQPLPYPLAPYVVPYTTLLGCQVQVNTETQTEQVDPGPPPVFDRYPLYLSSPFEAVESYLPSLTAAGVRAVLRYR